MPAATEVAITVTVPETSEACSPAATLPALDTSRARTKRLPRFRSGRFIIILFSAEGGADPRMCRYDQIAPSRPAMGPYPATDRKDTIRCLFKRMARVFKYDAALERLCSNIVQAAVMEETMKQGRHGQPIAHSRHYSAERHMPPLRAAYAAVGRLATPARCEIVALPLEGRQERGKRQRRVRVSPRL
jgi:hypothetical protein